MTSGSRAIMKTYVYHADGRRWFVSTIKRDFDCMAAGGIFRGIETIVWEWDEVTGESGNMIGQYGSDHHEICRNLLSTGNPEMEES